MNSMISPIFFLLMSCIKNKLTFLILLIFYFEIITTNTVFLSRSYIFLGGFILFSILISHKVKKENSNYFNSFLFNIIIFVLLFLINIQIINNITMTVHFWLNRIEFNLYIKPPKPRFFYYTSSLWIEYDKIL